MEAAPAVATSSLLSAIRSCDDSCVVFTLGDRDRVRDRVLDMASSDARVVAGAAVGSLAHDQGDQWSDLDLTFALADDVPMTDVLEDWSRTVVQEFGAVHLFDLPSGPTIYRVFLFPNCLELDLSFFPRSEFTAGGPKFNQASLSAAYAGKVRSPNPGRLSEAGRYL